VKIAANAQKRSGTKSRSERAEKDENVTVRIGSLTLIVQQAASHCSWLFRITRDKLLIRKSKNKVQAYVFEFVQNIG
jgi:hypothetical protein